MTEHVRVWAKLKTAGDDMSVIKNADDVIAECGLTGKARSASETLSGGQKRRLQLAIAFSGGSQVCCIDEASSGLVCIILLSFRATANRHRILYPGETFGTLSRKDADIALPFSPLIS